MVIQHLSSISNNIIRLFQRHRYEKYLLEIINASTHVFPGNYEAQVEQSNGECDFYEINSKEKYDAKLPFLPEQVKLLTTGNEHTPEIGKWIAELHDEASEFNPIRMRDNQNYDISENKLYKVMKNAIISDSPDENIIFFLPYPIVISASDSIFLQFATDYLKAIYDRLTSDIELCGRKIYAIYPASEKNQFALRDLSTYYTEFIYYDKLADFFTYEIIGFK